MISEFSIILVTLTLSLQLHFNENKRHNPILGIEEENQGIDFVYTHKKAISKVTSDTKPIAFSYYLFYLSSSNFVLINSSTNS